MSRSSINFNYKKILKSDFYNKIKKYINKLDEKKKQCLLWLKINFLKKITIKYGEKDL